MKVGLIVVTGLWEAQVKINNLGVRIVKKQRKPIDLIKRDFISLNIDLKQMGVGGDNSWGARTLNKYILEPGDYEFSFTINPLR